MRLEYVEAAKLVLGNRGISTERGQMAYITETKLGLDVPKESGSCKVGAFLNEPVTQSWKTSASGTGSFWRREGRRGPLPCQAAEGSAAGVGNRCGEGCREGSTPTDSRGASGEIIACFEDLVSNFKQKCEFWFR